MRDKPPGPTDDATLDVTQGMARAHEAAPTAPPTPLSFGRYEVRAQLGRGGMGVVYLAFDPALAREVALKVLHERASDGARARFLREARAVAALDHPHVVPVYDVGFQGDLAWFTMPVVRGETLAARQRRAPLSRDEALAVGLAVAEALAEAHRRGLVHRDVKPSNVLLQEGPDGPRPLLADFGLATEHEEGDAQLTQPGDVIGTPMYMPPEQAAGQRAGPAADVYALGAVLYELLAGVPPYDRSVPMAVLLAVISGPPVPLSARAPQLDAPLRQVVERAMHRAPEQRYPDGAALLAALRAVASGAPEPTPAPPPPGRPSLPREHDRFVGRAAELAALATRYAEGARVVTLLGPGGMGKTRLATRYAWETLAGWPGGAWFCDLAAARDHDGLMLAISRDLDVPLGKGDATTQLGYAIAGRGRALLVLDNVEQVVSATREALRRWLELAPEARFLVTSRELLRLPDESVAPLDPLEPEPAASLFQTRAAAVRAGFAPDSHERAQIEQLVALLEGMPLPIELAAARLRVLSVAQVLARLSDRFRLLAAGHGPDRHATLRAVIDWSWELLSPAERSAFAQCSVFAGSFTIEAAEAVIDLSEFSDAFWAIDLVQSLVEKSLLRTDPHGAEPRLAQLVDLATYGAEKLRSPGAFPGSGPAAEARAIARHAAWYARLGATDGPDAPRSAIAWRRLVLELDNTLAATRRAVRHEDLGSAVPLAQAVFWGVHLRGPFGLAVELLSELSPRVPAEAAPGVRHLLAHALYLDGQLSASIDLFREVRAAVAGESTLAVRNLTCLGTALRRAGGTEEASDTYQAALDMARRVGDNEGMARAISGLAGRLLEVGAPSEAERRYVEALALYRGSGQLMGQGAILAGMAVAASLLGQFEVARARFQEALDIYRSLGSRMGEAEVLYNLGMLHTDFGDLESASDLFKQAGKIRAEIGHRLNFAHTQAALAGLHAARGEWAEARTLHERAAAEHHALGHTLGEASWKVELIEIDRELGDQTRALARAEEALALSRPFPPLHVSALAEQVQLLAIRGEIAPARAALDAAHALNPDERGRATLAIAAGWLALAEGDRDAAQAHIRAAEAGFGERADRPTSWAGRRLAALRAALEAAGAPASTREADHG